MKFSNSVDMALRILVHLAEQKSTGLASTPEVSQALQVSYNNVVRIINRLQNTGIVVTHVGRYGGMELAQPIEEITVRAVVAAIDGPTKLAPCSHQSAAGKRAKTPNSYTAFHNCDISNCSVREELVQLSEQIDTLLDSVTIAAISQRHIARQEAQGTKAKKKARAEKPLVPEEIAEPLPLQLKGKQQKRTSN